MTSEWRTIRAADFIDFNPRLSLKKGDIATKVAMDKLKPFTKKIPETEKAEFNGGAKFCNGDTVMARITPCLENGKTAYVDMLDDGEIGFGSTEFIVMRAKKGISDPQFVYYTAINPVFRNVAIKSMVGSSGRQRVQQSVLEELELSVPDLDEQRRIGDFLARIDEKIALNDRINDNLQQQIRTLCNAWLNDYVPFGGVCPDDWELTPLASIAKFISGYSYKGTELQDSNIAMATIKNFDRKGGFKLDGYKEIVPSSKLKSEHHAELFDTLVAHTDLTQNAEVIGNAEPVLSFSGYDDIIFSMDVVKVIPNSPSISKFLIAAMLQTQKFKDHCLGYVNGTTVLHLSKKALPEYLLRLPHDFTIIQPLDDAVSSMYQQMALNIDESVRLAALRNSLLPKLMSGEIDVSGISI